MCPGSLTLLTNLLNTQSPPIGDSTSNPGARRSAKASMPATIEAMSSAGTLPPSHVSDHAWHTEYVAVSFGEPLWLRCG